MNSVRVLVILACLGCNNSSSGGSYTITPEGDMPLTSGSPVRHVERARVAMPEFDPLVVDTTSIEVQVAQPPAPPQPPTPATVPEVEIIVETDDDDEEKDDSDSTGTRQH